MIGYPQDAPLGLTRRIDVVYYSDVWSRYTPKYEYAGCGCKVPRETTLAFCPEHNPWPNGSLNQKEQGPNIVELEDLWGYRGDGFGSMIQYIPLPNLPPLKWRIKAAKRRAREQRIKFGQHRSLGSRDIQIPVGDHDNRPFVLGPGCRHYRSSSLDFEERVPNFWPKVI